jgi:hypothetical protein
MVFRFTRSFLRGGAAVSPQFRRSFVTDSATMKRMPVH